MRSPTGVKPFFLRFDCRLGFLVAVFVMRCRACDALGGRVTVIKSSPHDACQPKTFLSVASAFLRSFRYSFSDVRRLPLFSCRNAGLTGKGSAWEEK